ncbi:hypothetical protein TcWFU_010383 [Taenia crassiceps]|uniref:LysM domain-containing protein n=1 Tax=Taenia crassiceps TaxID=6207 RepID=A0ABR4Q930_9CEST
MTEETWILQECSRPKCYGTLCGNLDNESGKPFGTYVVKDSDTLTSIAVKNDVSVGQLKFLNRMLLSGDKYVVPGTVLRLPVVRTSIANQAISDNVDDSSVCSTTRVSNEQSISIDSAGAVDNPSLLMMDPLVQTITSSSHSLCKDRSCSSAGTV